MIKKLLPQKVKSRLKSGIQSVVNNSLSPMEFLKHIPHKYGSNSYLIPKYPEPRYGTCDFLLVVPPKEIFLGYGDGTKEAWLDTGKKHVNTMMDIVKASGFSFAEGTHILDFGCGAGRMIRYLQKLSESCEIWG